MKAPAIIFGLWPIIVVLLSGLASGIENPDQQVESGLHARVDPPLSYGYPDPYGPITFGSSSSLSSDATSAEPVTTDVGHSTSGVASSIERSESSVTSSHGTLSSSTTTLHSTTPTVVSDATKPASSELSSSVDSSIPTGNASGKSSSHGDHTLSTSSTVIVSRTSHEVSGGPSQEPPSSTESVRMTTFLITVAPPVSATRPTKTLPETTESTHTKDTSASETSVPSDSDETTTETKKATVTLTNTATAGNSTATSSTAPVSFTSDELPWGTSSPAMSSPPSSSSTAMGSSSPITSSHDVASHSSPQTPKHTPSQTSTPAWLSTLWPTPKNSSAITRHTRTIASETVSSSSSVVTPHAPSGVITPPSWALFTTTVLIGGTVRTATISFTVQGNPAPTQTRPPSTPAAGNTSKPLSEVSTGSGMPSISSQSTRSPRASTVTQLETRSRQITVLTGSNVHLTGFSTASSNVIWSFTPLSRSRSSDTAHSSSAAASHSLVSSKHVPTHSFSHESSRQSSSTTPTLASQSAPHPTSVSQTLTASQDATSRATETLSDSLTVTISTNSWLTTRLPSSSVVNDPTSVTEDGPGKSDRTITIPWTESSTSRTALSSVGSVAPSSSIKSQSFSATTTRRIPSDSEVTSEPSVTTVTEFISGTGVSSVGEPVRTMTGVWANSTVSLHETTRAATVRLSSGRSTQAGHSGTASGSAGAGSAQTSPAMPTPSTSMTKSEPSKAPSSVRAQSAGSLSSSTPTWTHGAACNGSVTGSVLTMSSVLTTTWTITMTPSSTEIRHSNCSHSGGAASAVSWPNATCTALSSRCNGLSRVPTSPAWTTLTTPGGTLESSTPGTEYPTPTGTVNPPAQLGAADALPSNPAYPWGGDSPVHRHQIVDTPGANSTLPQSGRKWGWGGSSIAKLKARWLGYRSDESEDEIED